MFRRRKEPTMRELDEARVEGDLTEQEMLRDDVEPAYFAAEDEKLLALLHSHALLRNLAPLASRLMRLTRISEREKRALQIDIDLVIGTIEADMDEDNFNTGDWALLQTVGTVLKTSLNDSVAGFKMDLLSRVRKELTLKRAEEKKRWFERH